VTALDRLDRFERWLARNRQTPFDTIRELEAIAASLRTPVPPSNLVPFPDSERDDRDDRRVIEVDMTR
jgi:hypothetical protein